VAGFEEDVDVNTATISGADIRSEEMKVWREQQLTFRGESSQKNNAVFLGWRTGQDDDSAEVEPQPSYTITLPTGWAARTGLDQDSMLVFSTANANETIPDEDDEEDGQSQEENEAEKDAETDEEKTEDGPDEEEPPIDFHVELLLDDGERAVVRFGAVGLLVPALKTELTKTSLIDSLFGNDWDMVLQTVQIPLSAFQLEDGLVINPEQISSIRFVFDLCPEGVIVLDDVGFARNRDNQRMSPMEQ
jgi:hypothetical protein